MMLLMITDCIITQYVQFGQFFGLLLLCCLIVRFQLISVLYTIQTTVSVLANYLISGIDEFSDDDNSPR